LSRRHKVNHVFRCTIPRCHIKRSNFTLLGTSPSHPWMSISSRMMSTSPPSEEKISRVPFIIQTDQSTQSKKTFYRDSTDGKESWSSSEEHVATPPNQFLGIRHFLESCFLPENFPKSVGVGYRGYFSWLALQSICGSASYVLSTKALLSSVGLSAVPATSAAAAISWVLKDGFGSLGIMLFASKFGTKFDNDAKRNRWRGDLLHNTGVLIELAIPLFPKSFLVTASIANVLKGVSGLATGATKASIHRNFSIQNNLGDITAKAQTQGIGCYLVGMALGISLSSIPGNEPASLSTFCTFGVLAACHLFSSYKALSYVQFSSINMQKLSINIDRYLRDGVVTTVTEGNHDEKIIGTPDHISRRPAIKLGDSIGRDVSSLSESVRLFDGGYMIVYNGDGTMSVILRNGAGPRDIIRSYFHAYVIQERLKEKIWAGKSLTPAEEGEWREVLGHSVSYVNERWEDFMKQLEGQGWDTNFVAITPNTYRAEW